MVSWPTLVCDEVRGYCVWTPQENTKFMQRKEQSSSTNGTISRQKRVLPNFLSAAVILQEIDIICVKTNDCKTYYIHDNVVELLLNMNWVILQGLSLFFMLPTVLYPHGVGSWSLGHDISKKMTCCELNCTSDRLGPFLARYFFLEPSANSIILYHFTCETLDINNSGIIVEQPPRMCS